MPDLLGNVSSLQFSLASRRGISRLTLELSRAEREVSTGTRADVFRDLGSRAAESVVLRSRIERNDSFMISNKLLAGRMEVTALAMGQMRTTAEEYLALAVGNRDSKGATVSELQAGARAALDSIIAGANVQFQGHSIFAGIDADSSALLEWTKGHPGTGTSPKDLFAAMVGSGPVTAADAQAIADEIASVFDGTHPDTTKRFEEAFYLGTPELLPGGAPAPRTSARIEEGTELSIGIQANDKAFRDVLRGLVMLASTDVAQIDDRDAYKTYVAAAVDSISTGVGGLLAAEGKLGSHQQIVEDTISAQGDRDKIYQRLITDAEGVDPYEAATRLKQLETQLNSSFAVSARLANLSILNFL